MSPSHGSNECATPAEVIAAIESLSAEQYRRLKNYARFRVRGLGRAAMGRTFECLLNDAVASTLQGAEDGAKGRKWAKNRVVFVNHLLGAMRSISTHWKESYERSGKKAEHFDWEGTKEDDEGSFTHLSKQAVDPSPSSFRYYAAKESLDVLDRHFADDQDALLVIEAFKEDMTVAEMVAELGITKKKMNAALQRVRSFVERLL
jgi:hypothetical protein